MNIIFDTENIETIKNNNIVLELDTFYFSKSDKTATAYCVVENVKITDLDKIVHNQKLHNEFITAYKNKNFTLCQDLLPHLMGAFGGEVDSFYQTINQRMSELASNNLQNEWNPIIVRED